MSGQYAVDSLYTDGITELSMVRAATHQAMSGAGTGLPTSTLPKSMTVLRSPVLMSYEAIGLAVGAGGCIGAMGRRPLTGGSRQHGGVWSGSATAGATGVSSREIFARAWAPRHYQGEQR